MNQRIHGPRFLPYAAGIVVVLMVFQVFVTRLVDLGIDAAAGRPFAWYESGLVGLAIVLTVAALFRFRGHLDPGPRAAAPRLRA